MSESVPGLQDRTRAELPISGFSVLGNYLGEVQPDSIIFLGLTEGKRMKVLAVCLITY